MKKDAAIKLFKESGNTVTFIGTRLEVRIPKDFFKTSGYSEEISDYISTLLLFIDIRHYKKEDGTGPHEKVSSIISPATIITYPSTTFKDGDDVVLVYLKNDVFILSTIISVDWRNASGVNKALMSGKLSNVKYGELANLVIEAFEDNNVSTGMPPHYTMVYLGEVCKQKNGKKLRMMKGVNKDTTEYTITPIKEIPKETSTAAALMFEGVHTSLAGRMGNDKVESKESPIEHAVLNNEPEKHLK